jgi:hypothetical protein
MHGSEDKTRGKERWMRRRFARARRGGGLEEGGETLESLRAELILLREENASLKASRNQPVDLGRLTRTVRAVPAPPEHAGAVGDDHVQALVDARVLRESLLDACREIRVAMVGVEERLHDLRAASEGHGARV